MDKFAAFFGILGAFILAVNVGYLALGWLCFLVSNGLWIRHAAKMNQNPLGIQHILFSLTSILGLYNAI